MDTGDISKSFELLQDSEEFQLLDCSRSSTPENQGFDPKIQNACEGRLSKSSSPERLTSFMTTVPDRQPEDMIGPLWNPTLERGFCETINHQHPRLRQDLMSSESTRRLSLQGQCTTTKCSSIQQRHASDPGC